jgi:chromosomal replication initiation ATPase DnaA
MLDAISTQAVFHILLTAENSISSILGKRIKLLPQEAEGSSKITPETIGQRDFQLRAIITHVTGIPWKQIESKSRKREIVLARQLYCVYAKQRLGDISLKSIGLAIGNRDHTTVIHSIQTVKDLLDTRHEAVMNLMDQINNMLLEADGLMEQLKASASHEDQAH